jgi:formylglycine-generating enzyme required for sulfatase activity
MLDADQEVEVAPDEEASGDSADPRTSKSEWTGSTPPYAVAPFGTGDAKAFQRQWAQHLDTRVEITNSIGMKLVLIPPGEFLMGSPRTDLSSKATRPSSAARRATKYPTTEPSATIADETPQHSVRINRPFYMGARDVTRAEYQRLIPAAELGLNTNPDLGDSAPVEFLSWDEAVAFCRRLSDQPDEKDAGRVYRLPREAEWEYACRAGTSTRHYAGDDLASLAASASQPKANAWGLRDMLGNVQQWCADWYGVSYYAASRLDDPEGPLAGTHRVVRGGGPLPANRRSALRHHETPKNPLFGFRVVCETASLPTGVADVKKPPPGKGPEPESPIASFDPSQAKQVQERWAKSLKIPVELSNSLGLRLVLVPPGEFTMGCDESDALPNEKPAHRVRITRPFYLGKCEVTWLQYSRIMPKAPGRVDPTDRSLPMTRVTWTSAVEFCRRLSEQPMESAVGRVYRLPTEAEWEYACRAGNTGGALNDEDANLGDYAWFDANSGGRPHPVGRKSPNPFGLHDMFGNVWEFCADWFADGYYRQSPVDDPQGPTNGAFKVLRGGAFKTRPNQPCSGLQPSHRGGIGQNMADDFIGFRVACSINERNAGTPTPNVKDSLDEPDE